MEKAKLYTSGQAFAASFLGGPMAMTYVLWKNFQLLGNIGGARHTLIWGTVFVVVILLIAPFIPSGVPSYALPVLYAVPARLVVEKYQLSKQAILQSDKYGIRSVWNVAAVTVGFLLGFAVLIFAWVLVAMQLGLIKQ